MNTYRTRLLSAAVASRRLINLEMNAKLFQISREVAKDFGISEGRFADELEYRTGPFAKELRNVQFAMLHLIVIQVPV